MAKGFAFLNSYYEAISELPDSDRLALYDAIVGYGIMGITPSLTGIQKSVFILIKPNIDSSIRRYESAVENGGKGGRPPSKKENNVNPSITEYKPTNNPEITEHKPSINLDYEKDLDSELDYEKDASGKKPPIRHKYGEYCNVLLSDADLEKLKTEFPSDWQQRIEKLSEYMASSGKTYKNHLATIRKWARDDKPKQAIALGGGQICSL